MRPIGRVVAHRQALLDADSQVSHPDDHVFFTHPRVQVALGREVAPILAVVENVVAQLGDDVFELVDLHLGVAQFLGQNRLDALADLAQHALDIRPLLNPRDFQQGLALFLFPLLIHDEHRPGQFSPLHGRGEPHPSQISPQGKGFGQVKDDPRRQRIPVAHHQAQGHQAVGVNKVQGTQIDFQGLPGHGPVRVVEKRYEEFVGCARRQLVGWQG